MNRKTIQLLFVCMLLVGGFAFYQFRSVRAQEPLLLVTANSSIGATPTSEEDLATVREAIETSKKLTTKWLDSIGSGKWLFISSKYETVQDSGIDPEIGSPIPNKSLWEAWYRLDSDGKQTTVLTRRTDLERGNVTYVAWQNGELLRLPSGVREDTHGRGWETFQPIIDHYCNTRLPFFLEKPDEGNSKDVIIQSVNNEVGPSRWIVTMVYGYPPVSDVTGHPGAFIGDELTCYRNSETGAVEITEEYLIAENGDRVLLWHDYDYIVMWVDAPPTEMLALLDLLNSD